MIYKHSWLCPHCGNTMITFLHDEGRSAWLVCERCGLRVNFTRVSRRRRMILYDE